MNKKKLVVLSGAGISAESGIATFRGQNGLWENHSIEDVASIDGFIRNPQLVLDFYNARRRAYNGCIPNEAHIGLSKLQEWFDVSIITQNVDDLHEQAGNKQVIHLHGELLKNCSVKNPNITYDIDPSNPDLHVGDMAPDGSQLRPFIVWFGEAVPKIEEAIKEVSEADIFVVIGTSLNVYPAAGLLMYVPQRVPIYLIDPNEVHTTHNIHRVIQKKASEGVRELIQILSPLSSPVE